MDRPHLDHVSITASATQLSTLGFRVTPTPGADSHARVLLDRCYLEVTPSPSMTGRAWFLRPKDVHLAASALRRAGIPSNAPTPYVGHDGSWLDVEATDPGGGLGLPIVTRRTDLDEATWPPPFATPHPNGATRLAELHVRLQTPEPLSRALEALGAERQQTGRFILGDGAVVVIDAESTARSGIAKLVLVTTRASPLLLAFHP